jgi:hypothetical protein
MIRRIITALLLTVTLSAMAGSAGADDGQRPHAPGYVQDCHGPHDCGYGDNGTNGDH